MLKQYKLRNYKFILVILVITLNIIGSLLVASARPAYQNKQILGVVAGIMLMVFVSLIDYRFILKFSWLIYIAMLGLLLAVMLVGDNTGGAQRWIDLGFMKFQPSELAKIMEVLPQALVNAKVPNHKKEKYMEYPEIAEAIEKLDAMFAGEGRVLIRPSGTEPLVRVMIEGKDQGMIEKEAKKLAELIQNIML